MNRFYELETQEVEREKEGEVEREGDMGKERKVEKDLF